MRRQKTTLRATFNFSSDRTQCGWPDGRQRIFLPVWNCLMQRLPLGSLPRSHASIRARNLRRAARGRRRRRRRRLRSRACLPSRRPSSRQPDFRLGRNRDHIINPFRSLTSMSGLNAPSALTRWPPASAISILPTCGATEGEVSTPPASSGGTAEILPTSTERNSAPTDGSDSGRNLGS